MAWVVFVSLENTDVRFVGDGEGSESLGSHILDGLEEGFFEVLVESDDLATLVDDLLALVEEVIRSTLDVLLVTT